ncbi:MAG: hypothetical protein GYB37_10730 [Algicola sp.]|nr:hypothetical protein [Algicola sp.]
MAYTVLTLALVSTILFFWLYHLMKNCFCRYFCIYRNQKNGSIVTKQATILSVNTLKLGKRPLLELLLLFDNLSGYPIHRKIRVWDSRPYLDRFKADKKIPIGINLAKKPKDPVYLSLNESRISFTFVLICSIKLIVYVSGCYLLVSEAINKVFASPDQYENIFANSNIWYSGFSLLVIVVIAYPLLVKIGLLSNKSAKSLKWDLIYYGRTVSAEITSFRDTGTLVNHNPLVEFFYSFKDDSGNLIKGSDKKIVGKLEIDTLSDIETMDVTYLPKDPSLSKLAENLEAKGLSKHLTFIFLLALFIFSANVIFWFYQTVF